MGNSKSKSESKSKSGPIASLFVAIGCGIASFATGGVAAVALASTAVCTGASAINNIITGNNNFGVSTQIDIGIGNGPVKVSSKMADLVLPTKDETVLLYDARNKTHNQIFVGSAPTTIPESVFDVDTKNIYKLQTISYQNENSFNNFIKNRFDMNLNQKFSYLNSSNYLTTNFDNNFYNSLLSMNTVQDWYTKKDPLDFTKSEIFGRSMKLIGSCGNCGKMCGSSACQDCLRSAGGQIQMLGFCGDTIESKSDIISAVLPIGKAFAFDATMFAFGK
jgi:hypothetical protein